MYIPGYNVLCTLLLCRSSPAPDASSFWDDVRDPIVQTPGDVMLVFDCTALPETPEAQPEIRAKVSMASSLSTKQSLGVCVPPTMTVSDCPDGEMAAGCAMKQSPCRILNGTSPVNDDAPVLPVQRLCSFMKEGLRETELAQMVFVSQLSAGQLLNI
ncbi:hypothetical protein VTK26DRAFT_1397 [Humicola hyalothermophila]